MGFYNANTVEEKRIQKLTGDINISEAFKSECEARGIAIYNAYNIQKRLLHEAEEEQLHGVDEVDKRLMELLDERSKKEVSHNYIKLIGKEADKQPTIPPRPDSSLPPKDEIVIPPRGRDGKEFPVNEQEPTDRELLNKIITQNQKIINQNKIIIEQLKKLGENND